MVLFVFILYSIYTLKELLTLSDVHLISICAVKITAFRRYFDGSIEGDAVMSGFLWRNHGETYLITNWHNVTGKNPETKEYIGGFAPSHFSCQYRAVNNEEGYSTTGIVEIPLFDDEDNPRWIEHSQGSLVDVVAIPFNDDLPETYEFIVLNEQDLETDWLPRVGDDSFIVGFPEGMTGPLATPIWKRGSLATEPKLDHEEKPMFLIDTIANKGLSGSSVIGRSSGILARGNSAIGFRNQSKIGTWENFIGIYSGRVSKEGVGSQLGRVWKATVLIDIFHQVKKRE